MAVFDAIVARDQRCRLADSPLTGPCLGRLTPHHLRKAAKQGPYTVSNLLTLCAAHNDWVETSPAADHVRTWGLVISWGDTLLGAWARLQLAGIVNYWWDGSPADLPHPEPVPQLT